MSEDLVRQAPSLLHDAGRLDLLMLAARAQVRPVRSAAVGVTAAIFAFLPPRDDEGPAEEVSSKGHLRTQQAAVSVMIGQRGEWPATASDMEVNGPMQAESGCVEGGMLTGSEPPLAKCNGGEGGRRGGEASFNAQAAVMKGRGMGE
ncbi:hypothetical protein NDU88_002360 [Pleurodeles waltl]|uniref:Uncharacterized protein n=1 Tax=Pleurodeles waltl TaxID=8319 RepID=A0AAV7T300_PLEWA|nr:hypothetical protein NDU88_002360 [Pleurodeles waltl]